VLKRATVATICCVSAAGCFAPPVVNTEWQEHVKAYNVGHRQVFV